MVTTIATASCVTSFKTPLVAAPFVCKFHKLITLPVEVQIRHPESAERLHYHERRWEFPVCRAYFNRASSTCTPPSFSSLLLAVTSRVKGVYVDCQNP